MGSGGQSGEPRHNASAPPHAMLASLLLCMIKHTVYAIFNGFRLLLPRSYRRQQDTTGCTFL